MYLFLALPAPAALPPLAPPLSQSASLFPEPSSSSLPTGMVELRTAAIAKLPAFKKLDAADQAYLLSGQPMNGAMAAQLKTLLGLSPKQFMDFGAYSPDPGKLADGVVAAVEAMMPKRQRLSPNDSDSGPTSRQLN